MKNLPSISIITCTWNADIAMFTKMLELVKVQEYPKKKIEHIVMDAGSTNGTVDLAKKYGCRVIVRPDLQQKEQVRASLGVREAKNDIILTLESDNFPTSADWLQRMVQPFVENKNILGTFSAYNSYEKAMPATTRYCALIGANDPTIYFLNKTEKIPLTQKVYNKGKILSENNNYYTVRFTEENLPTIGDNGHMVLRSAINKVNKNPETYVHVDAFMQLLLLGYDTYGVVKNSIIHIANPNVKKFVARRVAVKEDFYNGRFSQRKYKVFNPQSPQDVKNLAKFIFFSLTLVEPLVESINGYRKIPDTAWFLHPIVCFMMVVGYGKSEMKWVLKRKLQ